METRKSRIIDIERSRYLIVIILMLGIAIQPVLSQEVRRSLSQKTITNYVKLEETQDRIEYLTIEIYKIMDKYPKVSHNYTLKGDGAIDVSITGMPDNSDREKLHSYLIELKESKNKILNLINRVGVYYVTETNPEPKFGYKEFYDNLYRDLTYPTYAKKMGVEGNVIVKFVVEKDGEVTNVVANESIESSFPGAVEDLKEEAVSAVQATSGDWIPSKVAGQPVAHLMEIPIEFKIESPRQLIPL